MARKSKLPPPFDKLDVEKLTRKRKPAPRIGPDQPEADPKHPGAKWRRRRRK